MENTIRTQVIAKYRGVVLGYFDNAEEAQAAIDAARAEYENEDEDFATSRGA